MKDRPFEPRDVLSDVRSGEALKDRPFETRDTLSDVCSGECETV